MRHAALVLYPQRVVEGMDGYQGVGAAPPQMLDSPIDRRRVAQREGGIEQHRERGCEPAAFGRRFECRTQYRRAVAFGRRRDHIGADVGRLSGEIVVGGDQTNSNDVPCTARSFQGMQRRRRSGEWAPAGGGCGDDDG